MGVFESDRTGENRISESSVDDHTTHCSRENETVSDATDRVPPSVKGLERPNHCTPLIGSTRGSRDSEGCKSLLNSILSFPFKGIIHFLLCRKLGQQT